MTKESTATSQGFSLLELIAAVAVLSIISAISIPAVNGWIKSSKIDSAKAKLNSAAATCLQDIRSGADSSQTIDSNTLSDKLLESDGYKISESMKSCSSLMVESAEDDPYFFPMGFTISDGRLTKFAFPLSQDSKRSCEAWAGSNCKAGTDLLDLIAHNKAVEEAKTSCNDNFYSWLNGTPPGDGKRNRWNPTADSDCKRVPPANKGSTCTTNGCNLETWAFEGTIVAGEEGYKEALERKYGKICSEKLEQKLQQKYTGGPVTILECGASKKMWFYQGVDQGSEEEMNKMICLEKQGNHQDERTTGATTIAECGESKTFFYCLGEDKGTEDLMNACISSNKEASCQNAINEALANNHEGEFIAEAGGPGVCSTVIWMCKGQQYSSEASYEESECAKPACGVQPLGCRAPSWKGRTCRTWAECMGYL